MQKKKVRLSIVVNETYHKILKMYCVELGVTIKDFVLKAVDSAIDSHADRDRNEKKEKL